MQRCMALLPRTSKSPGWATADASSAKQPLACMSQYSLGGPTPCFRACASLRPFHRGFTRLGGTALAASKSTSLVLYRLVSPSSRWRVLNRSMPNRSHSRHCCFEKCWVGRTSSHGGAWCNRVVEQRLDGCLSSSKYGRCPWPWSYTSRNLSNVY